VRLDGKVALITGAASGIGTASFARYIAEGARIAAVSIASDVLDVTPQTMGAGERCLTSPTIALIAIYRAQD
jgi:NAD(P)-dependent dehydrogenase (short-subunit alcohol dehydrogenase family)